MADLYDAAVPLHSVGDSAALQRPLLLADPVRPIRPTGRDVERPSASRVLRVDADFDRGGAWAGVDRLVEMAYLDLTRAGDAEAIERHELELHRVLPAYRDRIRPRHLCLTDTAGPTERSRFYAVDRAYRLVHGLVGLVLHWRRTARDRGHWVVRVGRFDEAGHLAARFFGELARRGAGEIEVVIETRRETADIGGVSAANTIPAHRKNTEAAPDEEASTGVPEHELDALEAAADQLPDDLFEHRYPALLARQRSRGDDFAAARTALKAFIMQNSYGYYHEARRLLDLVLPHLGALVGDDERSRIYYVSKMNICLVMTNDPEGALRLVGHLASAYLTKPHLLANLNYILGMHHLRYAQAKDIELAERHILRAVEIMRTAEADVDPWQNPFQKVFIDNGLAFVRARQGRHHEAIALCEAGYDFLTRELGEDRHRLHRSVLQYNVAQVYVMLGRVEDGLRHYGRAIAMDPNYSEYHNETGNLLQDLGRYDEAIESYGKAIRCSAPYPEVYFNKAVCHARQGELDEALRCFDVTLELNPEQGQAHAFRADVLRELERFEEAIAGYDAAVALGADSAELRVNRAVLHFNNRAFRLALSDMDHAIAAEPREAAHYENRAAIHQAMERDDLYRHDLDRAERCREAA